MTHVPPKQLEQGMLVKDMAHEPLRFVSGALKGSQLRWAIVYKEVLAALSTSRISDYLLWGGAVIFCDHRNMGYIFCQVITGATSR